MHCSGIVKWDGRYVFLKPHQGKDGAERKSTRSPRSEVTHTITAVQSSSPLTSQPSSGRRLKEPLDENRSAHGRKRSGHFAQLSSPEGEGFQPSPMGTLITGLRVQVRTGCWTPVWPSEPPRIVPATNVAHLPTHSFSFGVLLISSEAPSLSGTLLVCFP
jgi:hypothetical protein